MLRKFRSLASGVALVLLAGAPVMSAAPAMAQTGDQVIAYLDKDGDGKCSLKEYLLFQAGRFLQADKDGDGGLSLEEFTDSLQGAGKANAPRAFQAFDRGERTGVLTAQEFGTYHAYVFNNFVDADHDSFMSAEEWSKVTSR